MGGSMCIRIGGITPIVNEPPSSVTHQLLAIAMMSPQGFNASPYLPNPECSTELNVTTVIGSESPWVEACVLESGAREVVTLEYGKIKSEHPKVTTMTPDQFRSRSMYSFLNSAEQSIGTFIWSK
jgi:hypothetical protein